MNCFDALTKDLPSSWSELDQLLYIDRGLTKEVLYRLDSSIKILSAAYKYAQTNGSLQLDAGVLDAGPIRQYLASCAQLRMLYCAIKPELLALMQQTPVAIVDQADRSLLECLVVYELLMQDGLGIPNTKLLELSKTIHYYCIHLRPQLWTLLDPVSPY
jgi:hypothetical protein